MMVWLPDNGRPRDSVVRCRGDAIGEAGLSRDSPMKSHPVAAISLTLMFALTSSRQGWGQATLPDASGRTTVTVEAAHPWVESGLTVRKGERLSFEATGTIRWGSKPDQVAGPEGHGAKAP